MPGRSGAPNGKVEHRRLTQLNQRHELSRPSPRRGPGDRLDEVARARPATIDVTTHGILSHEGIESSVFERPTNAEQTQGWVRCRQLRPAPRAAITSA